MGDGQPRLLDQVRDGIRRKHYSVWTEQAYVEGIRRFVLHYNKRHPRDMAEVVLAAYGLSGAGLIRRLPLLALDRRPLHRPGLSIVGQIAQYLSTPGSPPLRVVLYSLIALVASLCYLGGTLQGWEHPTGRDPTDESGRRKI